jgi:hypothetical protein
VSNGTTTTALLLGKGIIFVNSAFTQFSDFKFTSIDPNGAGHQRRPYWTLAQRHNSIAKV